MNLLNRMCLQDSPGLISAKISIERLRTPQERSSIISRGQNLKCLSRPGKLWKASVGGVRKMQIGWGEANAELKMPCLVQSGQQSLSYGRSLSFGYRHQGARYFNFSGQAQIQILIWKYSHFIILAQYLIKITQMGKTKHDCVVNSQSLQNHLGYEKREMTYLEGSRRATEVENKL